MAETSSSRLEPFLLLGRSTKGAAAAKVVMDATATNGVYVFAELLDLPNIQALKSDPSNSKYYSLLELFAYGTLTDYQTTAVSLPDLTPGHLTKLRHLSLVSLALDHRSLSYDDLLRALNLHSERELEDLIIDVIYAGLLGGKIHHHERILHIDWVSGRDLRKDDLVAVKQSLQNWCQTASALLSALDEQIDHTRKTSHADRESSQAYNIRRNQVYTALLEKTGNKSLATTRRIRGEDAEVSDLRNSLEGLADRPPGRLGARSVAQPDELVEMRSSKRQRETSNDGSGARQ